MLDISSRHVSAYVNHNKGNKVVEASTKEFCISRYLYKTSDTAAAFNIGRVIAQRCKDTGLYRVMWEHKWDRDHKKVCVGGWVACLQYIIVITIFTQFALYRLDYHLQQ